VGFQHLVAKLKINRGSQSDSQLASMFY
jgi:hypothetical protein